jgi:hypothetical protein
MKGNDVTAGKWQLWMAEAPMAIVLGARCPGELTVHAPFRRTRA